jgi:hypothetical protein
MALIVENGTGVSNANSYVTLADARSFLASRGLSIPVSDTDAEALLLRAMDSLDAVCDGFKGVKASSTQELQWPRKGVYIFGYEFPEDEIPQELVKAQCFLSYDLQTIDVAPATDGRRVTRERVAEIEVQYASASASSNPIPVSNKTRQTLAPLLKTSGFLSAIRV